MAWIHCYFFLETLKTKERANQSFLLSGVNICQWYHFCCSLSKLRELIIETCTCHPPLYARWLPVYLADMHALHDHPEVHSEFTAGNHSVSRTRPFGQVWSDMALEQSINCDSKSKGDLAGMTQKEIWLE